MSVCFAHYISKFNWLVKCQLLSMEESQLKRLDQRIFRDIQEISHSPSCLLILLSLLWNAVKFPVFRNQYYLPYLMCTNQNLKSSHWNFYDFFFFWRKFFMLSLKILLWKITLHSKYMHKNLKIKNVLNQAKIKLVINFFLLFFSIGCSIAKA